jgi:predicted acetyltransferase
MPVTEPPETDRRPITIERPAMAMLPAYVDALRRGWSPDNIRGKATADQHLAAIAVDAAAFVDLLHDPKARGAPITLPDGQVLPRLPGYVRWIWDGDFCGSIGFRWRPGTEELPPHVLGHIGYAVVPWKRGGGCATRALALMLPEVWAQGLAYIELTTEPDNLPSQRVILSNGGRLVGRFRKPESYGGGEALRFRIDR